MRALAILFLAGCSTARPVVVAPAPSPSPAPASPMVTLPATRTVDASDTLFGTRVPDPYRWLEDEKAPEVKEWMAAQDRFARDRIAGLPGRDALAARLKQLYYVDSIGIPHHRGTRWFYTRTHADREKAIVYWREGEGGVENVLLDPNTMSDDGTVSIGSWTPSWDGKTVVYQRKANNSDEATLRVLDVATGTESPVDVIEGGKYGGPSWTPSGDGFYYTWLPPVSAVPSVAERPGYAEVRFHKLGDDPAKDRVVRERTGDATTFQHVQASRDGRWLIHTVRHGWTSTDVHFADTAAKILSWRPLAVGLPALFDVDVWRDRFYVHTNLDAPRWRVLRVDPKKPERAAWQEIVPQSAELLDSAAVVGGHLALAWLKNAASALEWRTLDGKPVRTIALPGLGSARGVAGEPDEDDAWYAFQSFTSPTAIYRTSVKTGQASLWAQVKLPIDPAPYVVDQVWFPSKDGTRVSMFLVHRRDLKKDGTTPFLLGGYGGFNISMTPGFSSGLYPWLEAGGGYALPNLRGGGEYGEEWHKAGMGVKKQNVFDDFIAAAEWLIANGYTKPARLGIRGGSNGGLLVGAAMVQRPELFGAVICAVPLLDMVRYHKYGSGKTWTSEYGTADDEALFRALHAYSPYHHVARAAYPPVLMLSADSDDRVDPMHARKMAAALQASSTSGHPVLLRIERHAGHGGADMVKQAVEQSADSYAFVMRALGMK